MNTVEHELITDCINHLNEYTNRVSICMELLTEEQVWQKPNEVSNSIGNLILHLCGNITQYVLSALGGEADTRQRDQEFSTAAGLNKEELMQKLTTVVDRVTGIMQQQDKDSLLAIKSVQGFKKSGLSIIIHITEHYSYHLGQIAILTKLICNHDLGFYKGQNLNIKNGE